MPELPEIAAHAERLEHAYAGAVLERFEPLSFTALKTVTPPPETALGRRVTGVGRRGKYLLLTFGDVCFVVHLMQGGRLRPDARGSRKPRGGVARWRFGDAVAPLLLTEAGTERRAGVWVVAGDPREQPPLDELGPEADGLDGPALRALLAEQRGRVHTVVRDQSVVAGIGRRLANELCHRARISPFARVDQLDDAQHQRLAEALTTVLSESLADERTRDHMANAADRLAGVHGRAGEACGVCGETVRSVEYRDYRIDYCPSCQTGGAILADNTFSRLGVERDAQPVRRASRRR